MNLEYCAVASWNPKLNGKLLKCSALGIPSHKQELLAQLMLGNILADSGVVFSCEGRDEFTSFENKDLDDHLLYLGIAAENRLALSTKYEGNQPNPKHQIPPISKKRLEFIRNYWEGNKSAVLTIERALSLEPDDDELWEIYIQGISQRWRDELPNERWQASHYLQSLRGKTEGVVALNSLSREFDKHNKRFLSALCHMASLATQPDQTDIYRLFFDEWESGVFNPSTIHLDNSDSYLVSVLLPTYNRPNQLREALNCLLEQSFKDFEVLIINDGGNPCAKQVVDAFNSENFRYFYKENGGHRSALNYGLKKAVGKYIAYLQDDDLYYPNHLQILLETAEKKGADFVCSGIRWVQGHWDDDKWIVDCDLTSPSANSRVDQLRIGASIADNTVLHRRDIVNKIGLFWEEAPRGGAWEYWVRASRNYQIHELKQITCEYRVPTASLPISKPAESRFFTEIWRIYFGTEFGEAALALGAFYAEEQQIWRESIKRLINVEDIYLRNDIYAKLWAAAVSDSSSISKELLVKLADSDPVTFVQCWLDLKSRPKKNKQKRAIPLGSIFKIVQYAIVHPNYALSRLPRMLSIRSS